MKQNLHGDIGEFKVVEFVTINVQSIIKACMYMLFIAIILKQNTKILEIVKILNHLIIKLGNILKR